MFKIMAKSGTIIVCDNDVYALMNLKDSLELFGFEIIPANNKKELIHFLHHYASDFVLLNLDLKDTDGISISLEIRQQKDVKQPFIVIYSQKSDDFIQITAFNSGADDYLITPLKPNLVAARLKAMLKRKKEQQIEKIIPQKGITIDKESFKIYKDGNSFILPKKEFEIVNFLFSNPNKVFTREEIAVSVWGKIDVAKQRTIDIHIRNIRKTLGNDSIKTLKGIGYSIV
jgi:two-component system alkaline phosphatase synthesis response regulator PhoP